MADEQTAPAATEAQPQVGSVVAPNTTGRSCHAAGRR